MNFQIVIIAVVILAALGALFGLVLGFAAKVFAVEVDPKEEAVLGCLPGANCGGCGFAGCSGYAAAVAKGAAPVNACAAGGEAVCRPDRRDHGRVRRRHGQAAGPGALHRLRPELQAV